MGNTPKHRRANSRHRLAAGIATATSLGTVMLAAASPASAFDNYTEVYSSDSSSVGRCALTLTNADYAAGTVRANVNASVRPQFLQGLNNTHVGIACYIFDKDSGALMRADWHETDGALLGKAKISTIPLTRDYLICAQTVTTLRSGETKVAAFKCAG
jgi:hypothetical protein